MLRFRLGRIPVEVHPSHLIVAAFIAWSFVSGAQLSDGSSLASSQMVGLMLAGIAVVFLSLLVHELGHALAALAFGYEPQIQLMWLGGNTRPNAPGPIVWWRDVLLTAAGPLFGFALFAVGWFVQKR